MIASTVEMEGTLQADGKLVLDEKPALPPGRVRVALQAIGRGGNVGADVPAVLQGIRAAQKARGHPARTKDEIDAAVNAMRGEDEERMQDIERLHEQSRRGRSGKPS